MKLFLKTFSIMLLTFLLLCPGAFATPVTIENWEFDEFDPMTTPEISDDIYGPYTDGDITGWEHSGDALLGIWAPAPTGSWYNTDVGSIGYLNQGSIWQDTGHTIKANNTFTLSLDIGNRSDLDFPDYKVSLMAYGTTGDTVLASSGALIPGGGLFETLTLSYNPVLGDVGKTLGIEIFSGGVQLNFDNVRLSNDEVAGRNAVPEPASMLLLGTGLLGLAGYGRKKKFFKK